MRRGRNVSESPGGGGSPQDPDRHTRTSSIPRNHEETQDASTQMTRLISQQSSADAAVTLFKLESPDNGDSASVPESSVPVARRSTRKRVKVEDEVVKADEMANAKEPEQNYHHGPTGNPRAHLLDAIDSLRLAVDMTTTQSFTLQVLPCPTL
ncbi:hypothetical protein F5148DRAFT_1380089 [Russula earlei]|uniref:Uncharacterized protein n=1 Tax=Russula earlei TaxID=71964 RepID=A0ACC0TTF6_9AGAM|nr:hypothetical protein F5148DRAFT_1380089 [Russula earlei]